MARGWGRGVAVLLAMAPIAALMFLGGCAESQEVKLNPVWSATLPAENVTWTKTVNVFPLYSKNTTAFTDRLEETTNVLLFISWSKTTPRAAKAPEGPVQITPAGATATGSEACVTVPGPAAGNVESTETK